MVARGSHCDEVVVRITPPARNKGRDLDKDSTVKANLYHTHCVHIHIHIHTPTQSHRVSAPQHTMKAVLFACLLVCAAASHKTCMARCSVLMCSERVKFIVDDIHFIQIGNILVSVLGF